MENIPSSGSQRIPGSLFMTVMEKKPFDRFGISYAAFLGFTEPLYGAKGLSLNEKRLMRHDFFESNLGLTSDDGLYIQTLRKCFSDKRTTLWNYLTGSCDHVNRKWDDRWMEVEGSRFQVKRMDKMEVYFKLRHGLWI